MFQLIENGKSAKVFAACGEENWVYLAAEDLIKDLCRVSGDSAPDKLMRGTPTTNAVFIGTATNPQAVDTAKNAKQPKGREGYAITVRDDMVYILGADDLGTMWGIYTFSEEILKIPPCYLFDGVLPPVCKDIAIDEQILEDAPKSFGFRGFFINDEDLLTEWKDGGGRRNIDYPFYQQVIHPDVMEMIAETALRLKANLIIPSSFVDIDNPDEERLVEICARRGLYISQHHIEPMGVSYFAFQNYLKKRGEKGEISFLSNRGKMLEIWRYYAQKWAKYPRVIWQLGLRGKADCPVWDADKQVGNSDEERGRLISDAIFAQYDIIKERLNTEAFYSSTTLWMEGAALFNQGFLKIPKSTMIIFSDIGYNQMWADDFWSVKREASRKYGVYYHAQFWSWGPHLTEGVLPDKMLYNLKEAVSKNCGDYAILNISNIREFTLSAWAYSKMVWNLDNSCDVLEDICAFLYEDAGEAVAALYRRYFRAFAEAGGEQLKWFCEKYNFNYHAYPDLPFKNVTLNDGFLKRFAYDVLTEFEHYYEPDLCEKFRAAEDAFLCVFHDAQRVGGLTAQQHEHLENSLILQSYTMFCLYRYARHVFLGKQAAGKNDLQNAKYLLEEALFCLEHILTKRACCEAGCFSGWYRGDKKMNINEMKQELLEFMKKIVKATG